MKVIIKKPKDFFGVYHLSNLLKYFKFSDDVCDKVGDFLGKSEILVEFFEWLDKVRNPKPKIIIEDFDVWDVDYTLSKIILPLLKKFKESERYGITIVDDTLSDDENKKLWEEILDKMIFSFENILNRDHKKFEEQQKIIREGLELFGKYFQKLWD